MKFTCKAAGLLRGIAPVVGVATHGAAKDFDGANRINMEVAKDELLVSSFNGRVAIKNVISNFTVDNLDLSVESPGTITLNSTDLQNTLGAFRSNDELIIEVADNGTSKEFNISAKSDKDEFISLPCCTSPVTIPVKSDQIGTTIVADRANFVYCVNKILFAIGFEKDVEKYRYWVLRVKGDKSRFVAGTGGRFAVLDVEGKDLIQSKKDVTLLTPKEHTEVIMKTLSSMTDEKMTIKKTSDKSDTTQIIFEIGRLEIIFVEVNPDITYIDENKILDKVYPHKFVTDVSDWEYLAKGITATYNEDLRKEKKVQVASAVVSADKTNIIVKIDEVLKASRKVPIIDCRSDSGEVEWKCVAGYLKEIADYGTTGGRVQVEIESPKSAVIVRHYASDTVKDGSVLKTTNESTGMSEWFTVFFVTMQE